MTTFIVNVYKEPEAMLLQLLEALRTHYPSDKIVVFEDGGAEYPALGEDLHKRFEHRKESEWGGFWTHRYLDQALRAFPSEHYIKIDPDTLVIKAALGFPEGEAIFSAVYTHHFGPTWTFRVPHGGALGFTAPMASRIVQERFMLAPEFCRSRRHHAYNDIMLADAIERHGLTLIERADFACGKTKVAGPDTTFSHVH